MQAFAARQAAAGQATTAAKSLRRAVAESPQSASAAAAIRRRCLTFETPRPGSARARARLAATPGAGGAARTPQPGAFTTPGPRRRGRASLDSAPSTGGMAPPETPDFGDADGVQLTQPRSSGACRRLCIAAARLTITARAGAGCRKCHCKKSKVRPGSAVGAQVGRSPHVLAPQCLKLYCECFASGTYCDSGDGIACNCQNCLNTPCNAGLVAQTRQLIQSRNPLAFCPKIVVKARACVAVRASGAPMSDARRTAVVSDGRRGRRRDAAPQEGLPLQEEQLPEALLRVLPGGRAVHRRLPVRRMQELLSQRRGRPPAGPLRAARLARAAAQLAARCWLHAAAEHASHGDVRRRAAAALCRRLHHVSCRRPGRPAPPLHVHYMPVCLRAAACNLIPYTAYVRADRNQRIIAR